MRQPEYATSPSWEFSARCWPSCDQYLAIPYALWAVGVPCSLIAWWVSFRRARIRLAAWLVFASAFALAGLWHHMRWRLFPADDLGISAVVRPSPVCVEAIALSAPRPQPAPPRDLMNTLREQDEVQFSVQITAVRDGRQWRPARGQTLVRMKGEIGHVHCGDRLRLLAALSAPAAPLNPGEPDFAFYERSERRLCRLQLDSPECVKILKKGGHFNLTSLLNSIRDQGNANLCRHLSPARAGLAAAVLLGTREQVDRQRNEDFMTTGTIHLLSISGLHVGILAYGFWIIARLGWLSRKKTLVAAIVLVVLYAMLTESRPPVIRAAVLITAMCAARFLGREAMNLNTLAAAGIIVLALNPCSFFQAGTQLSFMAVATMAALPAFASQMRESDPLARLIAETRPWPARFARRAWSSIWNAVALSAVIWLVALPLVMYQFHVVSPVATVLNPIVCVPMGVALFAGFGVMLFGGIAPPAGAVCGWLCDVCLEWMEWCIDVGLACHGNHWWVPEPPLWWVMLFYFGAAAWLLRPELRLPRRWLFAVTLCWFAIGGWITCGAGAGIQSRDGEELVCHFVSVGHGTSVLLEFPAGETVLYDAGRLGTAAMATRSISSLLWSRGITHLDALIISHADADHFNAIPALLDRFSVGVIYVSPVMFRHDTEVLSELRRRIQARGVTIRTLWAGDELQLRGRARAVTLHPPETGVAGSDNANSIVLLVEYSGRRILLPGDLESPGLDELLSTPLLDSDVSMAPHHGSARSNPVGFARWTLPEYVVISGGLSRDASQVVRAYEAAGAQVLHTAEVGAVEARIRSGGYVVRSFRGGGGNAREPRAPR